MISKFLKTLALAAFALTLGAGDASFAQRGIPGGGYHPIEPPRIVPTMPEFDRGIGDLGGGLGHDLGSDLGGTPSAPTGSDTSSLDDGGGAGSPGTAYAYDAPRRRTTEEVWASTFSRSVDYDQDVKIGARDSQTTLLMAQRALDAPLVGRPVIIALFDPNADGPDIARLREAASGTSDLVLIKDPANAYTETMKAVKKYAKRPIIVVGHVEQNYDGARYVLNSRAGESRNDVPINLLNYEARLRKAWVFSIGCDTSAAGAAIGTHRKFTTGEAADAIATLASANSRGDIIRSFARKGIPIGVDASALAADGLLVGYAMSEFDDAFMEREATFWISAPPPELPKFFALAIPAGCGSLGLNDVEVSDCRAIETSVAKLKPSPLRHWPWAVGGAIILFIVLGASKRR